MSKNLQTKILTILMLVTLLFILAINPTAANGQEYIHPSEGEYTENPVQYSPSQYDEYAEEYKKENSDSTEETEYALESTESDSSIYDEY